MINREDEDLQIRVAEGQPLSIKSHTARKFSSVAEGQPSGAEVWDVSGLLNSLDRSTFSRETVSTWVNCAYAATYGPTELAPEDLQLLSSGTGLQQVLAFAHAVGSNLGLLTVACSQLASLKFAVKLPEQTLEVPIIAKRPLFALLELKEKSLAGTGSLGSVSSEQQQGEVRRCIAGQVAALLHIAHVLRLQPLLQVLHDWVYGAALTEGCSLLYGVLSLVFSEQVLEAAVGNGPGSARHTSAVC